MRLSRANLDRFAAPVRRFALGVAAAIALGCATADTGARNRGFLDLDVHVTLPGGANVETRTGVMLSR